MLVALVPDNAFALCHCFSSNRVFHGRGTSSVNIFFMYYRIVKDSCICFSLDEFSTGVLNALNVVPSQLHPNS